MIDDPVAKLSSSSTQRNSRLVHSTISSPIRDRWIPDHRRAERELGGEIPVAHGIDRVCGGRREAELVRGRDRVKWQRRAGQRAGTQRGNRCPHVPVAQPIDVACERLHVREQVMGEQHRLRMLQVRHARRGRILVPLGDVDQSSF